MEFVCIEAKTFMEMNEAWKPSPEEYMRHAEEARGAWMSGSTTRRHVRLWMSRQEKCYNSGEAGPSPTVT